MILAPWGAEYLRQQPLLPEYDESRSIHAWREDDHAICGATAINHDCRAAFGTWPEVDAATEFCPGCGRPICLYCRLLLSAGA